MGYLSHYPKKLQLFLCACYKKTCLILLNANCQWPKVYISNFLQWIRESNFNQQNSCKLQSKYNIMQNKERSSLCVMSVLVYFSEACGMFVAWCLPSNFWSTIYKYGVKAHSQNPKPQYYPNSSLSQIQMLRTSAKTKINFFLH